MKIHSTNDLGANRLKILIYGEAGSGKTSLVKTLKEKTLVISAEAGLLSIKGSGIDYIDVSLDDNGQPVPKEHRLNRFQDVYKYVLQKEVQEKYKWLFIDSLTEIGQNLLEGLQKIYPEKKDGMNLWGDYDKQAKAFVKSFRDLPYYNVCFTALEKEEKDNDNRRHMKVDMDGKVGKRLPAFFDEVFWLHVDSDTGERHLWTSRRDDRVAKDRSGMLDTEEPADLQLIVNKIRGTKAPHVELGVEVKPEKQPEKKGK